MAVQFWNSQPTASKVVQVIAYLAAVWFIAAIIASQWRNIIRLFEGYPFVRVRVLDDLGKNWHRNNVRELTRSRHLGRWYSLYWEYPAMSDVLPTRLGNIL
ncbi:MAG: hypothetical protein ACRDJT_07605, partial [Actinomycetota bacterium]